MMWGHHYTLEIVEGEEMLWRTHKKWRVWHGEGFRGVGVILRVVVGIGDAADVLDNLL